MQHFELIEVAKLICAELHLRELHKREHARLRRAQIKTFARQRRYLFVCFVLHKAFFQIDGGRGQNLAFGGSAEPLRKFCEKIDGMALLL